MNKVFAIVCAVILSLVTSCTSDELNQEPDGTPSTTDNHEYVDLGLKSGIKWASCNIGAENPGDFGDYFAWGETETKITYSSSLNYS